MGLITLVPKEDLHCFHIRQLYFMKQIVWLENFDTLRKGKGNDKRIKYHLLRERFDDLEDLSAV